MQLRADEDDELPAPDFEYMPENGVTFNGLD